MVYLECLLCICELLLYAFMFDLYLLSKYSVHSFKSSCGLLIKGQNVSKVFVISVNSFADTSGHKNFYLSKKKKKIELHLLVIKNKK
jgi:hypothetical protein